jgi:hypothetical protein
MGTPMAFTSGTTNGFSLGATKRATVALNPATSLVSGNNWFNGVDVSTQYLIYSDTFSQGQAPVTTARPTAWTTPNLTDASLLALINTLPDRVGQAPYTDINVALQWLQNSEKYFLIKNGYDDIVTDGLIANLDAGWYNSYPGSGTVWTDLSGQGNNATLANSPTFTVENGGTLIFDGVDDYAYITDNASIDLAGDKSYGIWIKLLQEPGGSGFIGKADSSVNGMALAYGWSSNGFQNIAWNSVNAPALSANASDINNWYYIAGIQNGATRYIYVIGANGIRSSSYAGGNDTWNNSLNLTIGQVAGYYEYISVGAVHIYNRALSSVEVLQNYDAQKTRFGFGGQSLFSGVTQYFDFSKQSSYPGTGTNLNDVSGNGFNDTITDAAQVKYIDGVKCLDCSTGAQINGDLNNTPTLGNNYTIFTWARVISSTAGYRTLLRTYDEDHPLLVESGGNTIGYYDNNGASFVASSLSVSTLGLADRWVLYTIVGSSGTQQTFYINQGTSNSTVSANATGEKMDDICNHSGQIFGPVGSCVVYNNQAFTQSQVNQYFNATKQYYGYAPNNTISYGLTLSLDAGNPLSYPTTGTTWSNLVGTGNNLTLVNGPTFSSSNGGSIFFDGADDVAVLYGNPLITGTGDFTICSWVKRSSTNTAANFIAGNYGIGNNGLELYYYQNKVFFYAASVYITSVVNINDTNWHFVCATRSSGTGNIYFDGAFDTSGSMSVSIPGNNPFTVGNGYNYTSEAFYGNIAVCQVYNRALSSQEISNNFNAQKATFGL